jgi:thiol:disulfide interchange protein DsbD
VETGKGTGGQVIDQGLWASKQSPPITLTAAADGAQPAEEPGSGWAMLWAIFGIFAGGIALNLTPCVYPLIPITISYFGAKSIKGAEDPASSPLISHALLYILGLAFTNSMLGVFAALSGRMLGMMLQNPLTLVAVAVVLVAFGLSMFGFWEFRLPVFLTAAAARNYAGYFGSLFMGLTLGIVAAPCIGPFVIGILIWVAGTGNPLFGFIVFFTLSLGMGLPLFVLALLSTRLTKLPKSGEWMLWVRRLMGWILFGMAAYFIGPVLPGHSGTILLAVTALAAGVHLGWLDSHASQSVLFSRIRKIAGLVGIGVACFFISTVFEQGEGIKWTSYSDTAMAEAKQSGKPIIVDFYADWCAPCRRMESLTFHHKPVVEDAAKNFVMMRVDLTNSDTEKEKLTRLYDVRGVPTVIFLKAGGEEKAELRIMEFTPPQEFLKKMKEARSSSATP